MIMHDENAEGVGHSSNVSEIIERMRSALQLLHWSSVSHVACCPTANQGSARPSQSSSEIAICSPRHILQASLLDLPGASISCRQAP